MKLIATLLLATLLTVLCPPAFASGKVWMEIMTEARRKDISYEARLQLCIDAANEAKKFGVDDPRYSESLRFLSQTHFQLLQYKEGARYVKEECALLEKMGDDYPGLDYDYYWLGVMAESRGDLDDANRLMKKALVLCINFLKPGQPTPQDIYAHLSAQAFARKNVVEGKRYAELAAKFLLARNKDTESVEKIMVEEIVSVGTYVDQAYRYITMTKRDGDLSAGAERMLQGYRAANRQLYLCLIDECKKKERPESPVYMRSLRCLAEQLILSNDPVLAKLYIEPAIKTAEKYYSDDYVLLADLYYYLGCALKTLNNAGAEECFKRSIHYKLLARWSVSDPLVTLTLMYENRGQYESGIVFASSLLGKADVDTKLIHSLLGGLYVKLGTTQFLGGKREESLKAFKTSMEEFEKAKQKTRYLFGAWQLAHDYLLLGHIAEAEPYFKIVVQSNISGKSFEDDDLVFRAKQELAQIYSKTGRENEAHVLNEELKNLSYFEKEKQEMLAKVSACPAGSVERRAQLTKLALLEKRVGDTLWLGYRPKDASALYESAAKHFTEALNMGLEYYLVQSALGENEIREQKLDLAEKRLRKAFVEMRFYIAPGWPELKYRITNDLNRIYQRTGAHPPFLTALSPEYQRETTPLIASIYLKDWQYRPDKAVHQLEQLVAIDRKAFGDNSMFVRQDLDYLGDAYFQAHDYKKAQAAYKEWLNIAAPGLYTGAEEIPGQLYLAEIYNRMGQYKEAEALCRKVVDRGKVLAGMARVRCMQVLGTSCILQGRFEEGRRLYSDARQLCPTKCAFLSISRVMPRILEALRPNKAQEEIKIIEEELAAYQKAASQDDNAYAFLVRELAAAYTSSGNTDKGRELLKTSLDKFKPGNSTDVEIRREWLIAYQRALLTAGKTKEAGKLNEEIMETASPSNISSKPVKQP